MEAILNILNRFFDFIWTPLSKTSCYIDFILISAISAVIFLILFKKTSNQEKIQHFKNILFAHILEIRLYKDQPLMTLKIIFDILLKNLTYLRYTIVPIFVILPFVLIISIQLNNRYGYLPIKQGDTFVVRVALNKGLATDIAKNPGKIRCETSKGVLIETQPILIESEASIYWRAKVTDSGNNQQFLRIMLDGTGYDVKKKILTNLSKQRFSPERQKYNLEGLFLDSSEGFISDTSPFEAVSINYNRATYPFLFWNMDPIVLYFVLTLLLGLAFKPFLKVNI